MAKNKNKKPKSSLGFGGLSNVFVTMPEPTKYHLIEDGKFQEFMKVKKPKCLVIAAACASYAVSNLNQCTVLLEFYRTGELKLDIWGGLTLLSFIFAAVGGIILGIISYMSESEYKKILKEMASRPAIIIDPKTIDKMYASQKTK